MSKPLTKVNRLEMLDLQKTRTRANQYLEVTPLRLKYTSDPLLLAQAAQELAEIRVAD